MVYHLDVAQEKRMLTDGELELRRELKSKCLGLASLARTIARQRSQITFLAKGDASTQFFHLQACHRWKKNVIESLLVDDMTVVQEEEKTGASSTISMVSYVPRLTAPGTWTSSSWGYQPWTSRTSTFVFPSKKIGKLHRTSQRTRPRGPMDSRVIL